MKQYNNSIDILLGFCVAYRNGGSRENYCEEQCFTLVSYQITKYISHVRLTQVTGYITLYKCCSRFNLTKLYIIL